jgi:transposase InsO family protein
VGHTRVERLMREAGISGLQARKRGRTTVRVPGVQVADDLVQRQFRPRRARRGVAGGLHVSVDLGGMAVLAAVQDAFSRRIVGWSMADHMRSELVVDQELTSEIFAYVEAFYHPRRRHSTPGMLSPSRSKTSTPPRARGASTTY